MKNGPRADSRKREFIFEIIHPEGLKRRWKNRRYLISKCSGWLSDKQFHRHKTTQGYLYKKFRKMDSSKFGRPEF